MSLSVMLQVFFLTALTVAFPFRVWMAMLASAELGERVRKARELREAMFLRDTRAELMTTVPVALPPPPEPGGLA